VSKSVTGTVSSPALPEVRERRLFWTKVIKSLAR